MNGAPIPWGGGPLPPRLKQLGKLVKGRPTWMAGVIKGCTCEGEQAELCATCTTAAEAGSFPQRKKETDPMPRSGEAFEIYEDKAGEFRWRVTAANGEIVGASSEGYVAREDCASNAALLAAALTAALAAEIAARA